MKRLPWLDYLKAIGILFVVTGHVYAAAGLPFQIMYATEIPLFFMVSGYLSSIKREEEADWRQLFIKKTKSLLVPYFVYSIIVMVWQIVRLFLFHYGSTYELLHCLADIICLEGISGLWFLSVLYLSELLYLFTKRAERSGFLFAGYLFLAFITIVWIKGTLPVSLFMKLLVKVLKIMSRVLTAVCFIYLGAHAVKALEWLKGHKTAVLPIAAAAICGISFNGVCDFHYLNFNHYFLYFVNAAAGVAALAYLCMHLKKMKLLQYIGRNSLFIMATHLIVLDFVNIMAVILSDQMQYYLCDKLFLKLTAVFLIEALLLFIRSILRSAPCNFQHSEADSPTSKVVG